MRLCLRDKELIVISRKYNRIVYTKENEKIWKCDWIKLDLGLEWFLYNDILTQKRAAFKIRIKS